MLKEASSKSNKSYLKGSIISLSIIGSLCFAAYFISSPNFSVTPLDFKYNLELEEFKSFISKYNKDYKTDEEFNYRLKVFKDNLSYINLFNSQGETWVMGTNQFSDMTHEEFSSLYKKSIKVPEHSISTEKYTTSNLQIPSQVDWTTKGCVTPVQNQGQCGSPYAFSAVGAIESAWCIAGHQLVELSSQEVIDCSFSFGNSGCNGGFMTNTYSFVIKNGITSAQNYPTTGNEGKCNTAKEKQVVATITSYANVVANNATALEIAIAQVPVSVGVDAIEAGWQNYKGGIVSKDCGHNLDHAVLAVGYNLNNSPPYYKCKNSWGTDWGEAGYIRISIVSGAGMCGIQMESSYPIV